jgi:3-polyprenyl-4-hydroxybenzoate decarboxylase
MGAEERRRSVAIAITGASGAIYATRTVAALLARGVHVELIVTDYAGGCCATSSASRQPSSA